MTIRTRPYFNVFLLRDYGITTDFVEMLLDNISDSHISYGDNEDTLVSQKDFFEFVEQTLNDWDNDSDIADDGGLPHTEEIRESIQKLKREFEEYDSAHPYLENVTIALRA